MSNTFHQIHLQFVFSPKYRLGLIDPDWEDDLYKYITGIVQNDQNRHKMLSINGMPDHVHLLVGLRPHQSPSRLMQEVKASSSRWINDKRLTKCKFEWQGGFGAFSYAKSDIGKVIEYIKNQKEHHKKVCFLDEYKQFLRDFEIPYDPKYIFREQV
jgi:putative transposase